MKRLILFIVLLLLSISLIAVPPISDEIGLVITEIGEGTEAEMVLSAMKDRYDDSWNSRYGEEGRTFIVSYGPLLSRLLPMTNLIISKSAEGEWRLFSLDTLESVIVVVREGKIHAVSLSS